MVSRPGREAGFMKDGTSKLKETIQATDLPPLVNADDWLQTDPPEPDQILTDIFDRGDKVVLIGSSKSKKTFFFLQLLIDIATGRSFLGLHIPKPRRILHIQYEIQAHHFHRRLRKVCRAKGITDLGGRLFILNARGLGMSGAAGIEKIRLYAEEVKPDLISLDPLYKVLTGDENSNSNDGLKGLLDAFDGLAETTGAAIMYAHHDPKGTPGDRATTDRGAGGGVLGRDFDASIVMTPHATEEDAYVIETSLRNYRPIEPFTALWSEDESTGGYCFEARLDILATKKTSKSKEPPPAFDSYLPTAAGILGDQETALSEFLEAFKTKTGLSDHRIRGFMAFATAGGLPYIETREDKAARNKKWLRSGKEFRG
jgi:hypothetical protein